MAWAMAMCVSGAVFVRCAVQRARRIGLELFSFRLGSLVEVIVCSYSSIVKWIAKLHHRVHGR